MHRPSAAGPVDREPRPFLLAETFRFVAAIRSMTGIQRIALVGSLATDKPDPKDADILVTVADDLDLTALAAEARRLQGRAQARGRGADIFLANPAGQYIGRICPWRACGPGIRVRCDARHCGRRQYLHDDLDAIELSSQLVARPSIQLWPCVECTGPVPADVLPHLSRLRSGGAQT